jgi:hypothetical protein
MPVAVSPLTVVGISGSCRAADAAYSMRVLGRAPCVARFPHRCIDHPLQFFDPSKVTRLKRMRRKAPSIRRRHHITGFDVRRDIPAEQLKALGAIAIMWTRIERRIDFAMCTALSVPRQLWVDLFSRINGFDGKVELIKKGAEHHIRMPPDARTIIAHSLGAISEHKRYRDGVIHAWVTNPSADIADTIQRKGEIHETFMSLDALDGLYERLSILFDEAADIIGILNYYLEVGRGREEIAQVHEACMSQALEHQKHRLALKPLPAFPLEPPVPPQTEAPLSPPD